ncbi:hypothetical protein A6R68_17502, partial [Neotoma lepida]
ADCGPGFRKFLQEELAACCFDCRPCPENEVSNETNEDKCVRCPEDQYANREQNQCIHKAVVFLNYKEPLGMALALISLCFPAFTAQITFGVVFTVAVSTVLAKTVTVLLAFIVIAPGRRMRYFLISGAPNYIIAILGGCKNVSELYNLIHYSEQNHDPPNYDCDEEIECKMVLTGPYWATSVILGTVLDIFKYRQVLQLTYGPFHPILSDREQFPYLYQMAPRDTGLALAMVSLILHFNWNWVGLAISDND